MRKRSSWYKDGYFAGYPEYRYGSTKPISLAGPKPKPIFSIGKRNFLISKLFDQMRDWRLTPFENEGPMRHALRAFLCLEGNPWGLSDEEAAFLVGKVLRQLGAERPTWEAGQPGYTEPRDQCSWCARPIDVVGSGKASRFCSAECALSALESRQFERRSESDKAYAAARRVLKRSRTTARTCLECGGTFHPIREKSAQKCCSYVCGAKYRARMAPPSMLHSTAVTLACAYCGKDFPARAKNAVHCSTACSVAAQKAKGGRLPAMLKPHVFDHFVTVPVNSTLVFITPRRFDLLIAA